MTVERGAGPSGPAPSRLEDETALQVMSDTGIRLAGTGGFERRAEGFRSVNANVETRRATMSTGQYVPPPPARDPRHCKGADDTCMAWKSAGTDYCAGHRRSIAKSEEAE